MKSIKCSRFVRWWERLVEWVSLFSSARSLFSLTRIWHVQDEWAEGHMLAAKLSFRWPQCVRSDLKKIIPSSNNDGIDLIATTLYWDPKRRPNAAQVGHLICCSASWNVMLIISEFKTSLLQSQSRPHELEQFSLELRSRFLAYGFC